MDEEERMLEEQMLMDRRREEERLAYEKLAYEAEQRMAEDRKMTDLERLKKIDALGKELRDECILQMKFILPKYSFARKVLLNTEAILAIIKEIKENSTCATQ